MFRRISTKGHWEKLWHGKGLWLSEEPIVEQITPLLTDNMQILEVSAGSGATAAFLASKGISVYALDYSWASMETVKASGEKTNTVVKLICADANNLPFKNGSFDIVYSAGLIEHFSDPIPILEEQVRILKNGAYLIIMVPQKYNPYVLYKHTKMIFNKWFAGWETEYSIKELANLASELELKIVQKFSTMYGRNLERIQLRLLSRKIFPEVFCRYWARFWHTIERTKIGPYVFRGVGVVCQK